MSEPNDDAQSQALMVLAGVIALVIAGVLGLAIWRTAASQGAKRVLVDTAAMTLGEAQGRIDFDPGSSALPENAESVLGPVAEAARGDAAKVVLITSYDDAEGAATNSEGMASKRAESVRHALEADGVAAGRLVVDKPLRAGRAADSRKAGRVELRLR